MSAQVAVNNQQEFKHDLHLKGTKNIKSTINNQG